MKHRWITLTFALFVIAGLALAACGGAAPAQTESESASSDEAAAPAEEEAAEPAQEAEAEAAPAGVTLKLARFFGDCDDTTAGVTDVSQATTECEVIQILTNKFNAENDQGITVERLGGRDVRR